MADDVRNPADISKRNKRSADWYEPSVQAKWTSQTGRPCPPDINSAQVYGHDSYNPQTQVTTAVAPATALYYDDPLDPVPEG